MFLNLLQPGKFNRLCFFAYAAHVTGSSAAMMDNGPLLYPLSPIQP